MGVSIRAVMTEGARVFRSKRFQGVLKWLGIKHKTAPPYTPRVNGEVERFIRTLLGECSMSGPRLTSTETRRNGRPTYPSGSTVATGTGRIPAWATRRPSHGWGLV